VLRLNESLPSLKNAMLRRALGERASKERVQSFKDRYAGPVAYGMWLLHRDRSSATADARPSEAWFAHSLRALAEVQITTILDRELDDEEPLVAAVGNA